MTREQSIKYANARIEQLREQKADFECRMGIYGLEITHYRPSFKKNHVAKSTEIIPIPLD